MLMEILFLLKELLAESKVPYFQNLVVNKDIGRLDVPVDDVEP